MKVKRRVKSGFGDNLKSERLIEIVQDEVDRTIDAINVVEGFSVRFLLIVSQDL